eukprot:2920415-Pyramimonas_sp.AAC.1
MAARLEAMAIERRKLMAEKQNTQWEMEDMALQMNEMTNAIKTLKANEQKFETTLNAMKKDLRNVEQVAEKR